MAKVNCRIEETYIYTDDDREVEGCVATCGRCGRTTQSFGHSEGSKKRCLVLMRERCPNEEKNYYVEG